MGYFKFFVTLKQNSADVLKISALMLGGHELYLSEMKS
jgi:hypothetical protein